MIETLCIRGGRRLVGEVTVSGGKNAAVAIIPAAVLADSPSTIENLPNIDDVYCLVDMLKWLGADVRFENGTMYIDPRGIIRDNPPYELVHKMRASYYLVPVLLGRLGSARVPMPGGCDIGNRPIDYTIKGLMALGVHVETAGGVIDAKTTESFAGTEIFLDFPSVGATINTMLTAVCAEGNTTIHNAAKEPHIVDTANSLSSLGAWVKGAGTDVIRIRGGRPLHGSNYAIIPDQIETGTLMIAAAATHGDVTINGAIPTHMESLTAKLLEMGVHVTEADDMIRVRADGILRPLSIKTQVYPGFPTDLQQPMTALLSTVGGTSYVTETVFENRFRFVDELRRMGANIRVLDRTAVVEGVDGLRGTTITATDLRAGAAMIIAGLIANGETNIRGLNYILRGYERIDEKLKSLGADILKTTTPESAFTGA